MDITTFYNHKSLLNDAIQGAQLIINGDKFTGYIEREVTKGIYNKVFAGYLQDSNGVNIPQYRSEKSGESKYIHTYEYNLLNDKIKLDGKTYKVVEDREFTVKIQKTQIKAKGGARGLVEFLTTFQAFCQDHWEQKIKDNVTPCKCK